MLACSLALLGATGCGTRNVERLPGETYDAGPVFAPETKKITHTFRVRNTTGRTVRIVDVKPSCSCSSATIKDRTLKPWQETELEIAANVPNAYSRGLISCILKADDQNFPDWSYSLRFESLPRLMLDRGSAIFGNFSSSDLDSGGVLKAPPAPIELTVDVFGKGDSSWLPEPTLRQDEGLRAELRPVSGPREVGNGIWNRKFLLRVGLDGSPKLATGTQNRSVVVELPDGSVAGAIVSWRMTSPLAVAPSALSFGVLAAGQASEPRRILVRSTKGHAFRIASVEGQAPNGDGIHIKGPINGSTPGVQHVIEVTFTPSRSGRGRSRSGILRIATDDPAQSNLDVPWTALVRVAEGPEPGGPPSRTSPTISRSSP